MKPNPRHLHDAAESENVEHVARCLNAGLSANTTFRGKTPLMMAAGSAARSGTVEALLARGADTDRRNDYGQSALDIMRLNDRDYGSLFEKYRRATAG